MIAVRTILFNAISQESLTTTFNLSIDLFVLRFHLKLPLASKTVFFEANME